MNVQVLSWTDAFSDLFPMLTVVTDEARAVELDASDVVPLTFLSPHFLLLGFLSINAALKVLFLKVLCITEEICCNYL